MGDKKTILKDSEIKCRFCGRENKDVSFKKEAHVIPQLLGRAKPISKFECDECNHKFSRYETDLGDYLLFDRAIFGLSKKKGVPKYKSKSGWKISEMTNIPVSVPPHIKANFQKSLETKKVIFINGRSSEAGIKFGKDSLEITTEVKPFIPLNIFRVFTKIGFSLLDENEISNYSNIKTLLNPSLQINPEYDHSRDYVMMFRIDIPIIREMFSFPIVRIFKAKTEYTHHIKRTLVLYFGSKIFQIPLTSNEELHQFNTSKIEKKILPISPFINPFFSKQMFDNDEFYHALENTNLTTRNLYSTQLIKSETQTIKMTGVTMEKL